MEFDAHKREEPGNGTIYQTVLEHLTETAQRASQCLQPAGLGNAAYLAGLLHDMGKYTEAFQQYLKTENGGTRGSVIHTFQGCRYIMETFHRNGVDNPETICSELIAFAIGAHHGLFDCVDSTRRIGLQYRIDKQDISYESAAEAFLNEVPADEIEELFSAASKEISAIDNQLKSAYKDNSDYAFLTGLLARLILSAVIEGDRRDTAAFMNGASPPVWPENMAPIWRERLDYLEAELKKLPQDTPVARARHELSEMCRAFASNEPGIYRLNVPTGGGKTLSSLRYALAHAMSFNKRRIIFTSPLLSILEQNADVIHKFVGDDRLILEHHSNAVQTKQAREELDERELLVQSWDSPIIITTLVQLLNTMFSGKTTAIRRFQALCGSVIVIDEVQTVPANMLTMFNLAIQFLSEQCSATVVLCSATQPTLERASHPLRKIPEEIVPRNDELWAAFRRTELLRLPNHRLDELPELIRAKMETAKSLLVVCNKKDEAAYLLKSTSSPCYRSFHLSAAMCMQHRRDVLSELQSSLSSGSGEKVLCISTQVIEAGVDISFDSVIRLTAGMDSIVQAAGRCNRNCESDTPRPVYAVNCTDERLKNLRDIQRGKDASIALMEVFRRTPERFDNDLFSDASIRYYYNTLYDDMAEGEQDYFIDRLDTTLFDLMACNNKYVDARCRNIASFCLWQAFKTAGQHFSVFSEDTTDILVPYGRGRELIAELRSEERQHNWDYLAAVLKEANSYTVSVHQYQKKQLEQQRALISACDNSILILSEGFYNDTVGLTLSADNLAFMEE